MDSQLTEESTKEYMFSEKGIIEYIKDSGTLESVCKSLHSCIDDIYEEILDSVSQEMFVEEGTNESEWLYVFRKNPVSKNFEEEDVEITLPEYVKKISTFIIKKELSSVLKNARKQ